ncbi:MAG TPA: DUF3592 domain-containing protein [Propionibacteriaceae bacterium]
MKALKILGIVFGILLLLTGGGLLAGSVLASKGQGAFEQELAKSGYAGPVEGTVKSVEQTSPVIVTVSYTDKQGKTQTGQGAASGATPPEVGDKVSTYYSTSDPSQILVVNVPGLANLSGVAATLRISGIICLIAGSVLLLAGILGLVLGKKPAAVATAPAYPTSIPGQQSGGSPIQPYPPQQPPSQPYPPQQYPPQQYPPQQYPQQYTDPQRPPDQPYPPQQYPPQR